MIKDNLLYSDLYKGVHPLFSKAFDFLKNFQPVGPLGKIEIEGDRLFVQVHRLETRPAMEMPFEAHRKYIDIQYIADGCELMQCGRLGGFPLKAPYNESKDVELYDEMPDAFSNLFLQPTDYCIFFPHDVHRPGCNAGATSSSVLKVLVKVKLN